MLAPVTMCKISVWSAGVCCIIVCVVCSVSVLVSCVHVHMCVVSVCVLQDSAAYVA